MHEDKLLRVAHIVPAMAVGGVEVGIVRSFEALQEQFEYSIYYVKKRGALELGQLHVFYLLIDIIFRRKKVDVVVTSLAWAHPFGFIFSLFGLKWVPFFHSTEVSGIFKRNVFSLSWKYADSVFVDSVSTGNSLSTSFKYRPYLVVNYLFPEVSCSNSWEEREVDIVFVGRSVPVKRLDLIADLIKKYSIAIVDFKAILIVSGDVPDVINQLYMEKPNNIKLLRGSTNEVAREIMRSSKYFILLSDYEGFSMSTVEAVLNGAIPVVRPVGEIPKYVSDNSGVIVDSITCAGIEKVVSRMVELRGDTYKAEAMSSHGIDYVNNNYSAYINGFAEGIHTTLAS